MTTIYVRKSRQEITAVLRALPAICRGQQAVAQDAVTALLTRIGFAALGRIKEAFVIKARGGVDDTGLSWPKLARSTVAYSRRHPGVLFPGSRRAPFAPSWMLTAKQRKRWWALYNSFGGTAPPGRAYHARGVNRGWAAARAWAIVKAEGAKTLLGEYGDTKVEILRDKGLLLNSLSPGVQSPEQVLRTGQGNVIVGTKRKWAGVHHKGNSNIPQRRLWPLPSTWTSRWWTDILGQARQGLIDIVKGLL